MTMTGTRRRRQRAYYTVYVQQQAATVSNVIANVAAVVVDVSVRKKRRFQRRTTNIGHVPSRRQLRHRRRRSVRDIYNELGAFDISVLLATCSPALSIHSCRMWQERHSEELSEWTYFTRCPTCLCHSVVCRRISI